MKCLEIVDTKTDTATPRTAETYGNPPGAASLGLAATLFLLQSSRVSGEDHFDYRFENYQEEGGRIGVQTDSWLIEKNITSWLSLKGEAVYDAISGATPTGAPPAADIKSPFPLTGPLNTTVPTQYMSDKRWGGIMDAEMTFGRHHITPQFSYSSEHDYISYGSALNYSLDLNEKNTTLNFGWAHSWDSILPNEATFISSKQRKDTDDFIVGVNQLLGPKTVLAANFTYRNAHGYMNDPYRGVLFDDYPQADPNNPSLFGENRPSFRQSYIGYVSLTQFVTPLQGSAEATYRFYHDSYGIDAHTAGIAWHQKIGSRIMITPLFRYYRQSAANFYATQFAGDPSDPSNPTPVPAYYSSDYRLSSMETFNYGVEITGKIIDRLSLDFAYKRYESYGRDHITSQSAYPKANIFTVGIRLWF